MNIKQHIPNFITILNLVCGVFATLFFIQSLFTKGTGGFTGDSPTELITIGVILILIATVLDFLDGFAARLLKVQSEIGAQLDSLADMVTFGVAPGFLFFAFINTINVGFDSNLLNLSFILIPIFSAIRLAKFNIDTEQTDYFKGIATPANAIFWIGIFFLTEIIKNSDVVSMNYFYYFLIFLVIIMSLLMTSNLRMFSLKLKNLKLEGDNIYRVILMLGAIVLTIIFGLFTNIMAAIPFIIILYILLSIGYHYNTRKTK
ncbi:MAG: CDP-alcohol phosphatidyltransferase family protein [Flavobacteriales bacterium]|tara:strand:+ start:569 stop:1348 length:780 start_codon:yes stop_codon:yes gene_type:complete